LSVAYHNLLSTSAPSHSLSFGESPCLYVSLIRQSFYPIMLCLPPRLYLFIPDTTLIVQSSTTSP
jgi:hypothetical protein